MGMMCLWMDEEATGVYAFYHVSLAGPKRAYQIQFPVKPALPSSGYPLHFVIKSEGSMGRYTSWAKASSNAHRAIYEVGSIIPFLSIPQRKVILTQARCQVLPEKSTVLYNRHRQTYATFIDYDTFKPTYATPSYLWDLAMSLEFFMNPVFSGLLSVMLRCAPHHHEGPIYSEIASGKEKEVTAAITPFRGPVFDYTCIFSSRDGDRNAPLTPLFRDIRPQGDVAKETYKALVRSKVSYS